MIALRNGVLTLVFLVLMAVAFSAHAEKPFNWVTIWNDGNQAAFLDPAPLVESAEDPEDKDSLFEYVWVPRIEDKKPLFCLRLRDARAAQCFYADLNTSRGEIEIRLVIPRGS